MLALTAKPHKRTKAAKSDPLIHKKDDCKRSDGSNGCRQNGKESLHVTPPDNLVGHDNRIVYH